MGRLVVPCGGIDHRGLCARPRKVAARRAPLAPPGYPLGRASTVATALELRPRRDHVRGGLSSYSQASIDRLGGNRNFGFFGISAPAGYYTLVFAHETPSDYFPQGETLPKGAPAYGFAGVYLTNSPKKTKSDKG
jgi:hypothetical protein